MASVADTALNHHSLTHSLTHSFFSVNQYIETVYRYSKIGNIYRSCSYYCTSEDKPATGKHHVATVIWVRVYSVLGVDVEVLLEVI